MALGSTSGERVIWQGTPASGLRFTLQDIFVVPFTALWLILVVAIIFTGTAADQNPGEPPPFLILPFFLFIGIYMFCGRFVIDALVRSRTHYVLTEKRAIIESGFFRQTIRSVNLAACSEIQFRPGRGDRGTVEFGSGGMFRMFPRGWPGAGQFQSPAFDGIEDAKRVYELALNAQRNSQSAR